MIKKYFFEDSIIYVGEAQDIEALYKSMCRASRKCNTAYAPIFEDMPKFNYFKPYGIEVDANGWFTVISADIVLKYILQGAQTLEEICAM